MSALPRQYSAAHWYGISPTETDRQRDRQTERQRETWLGRCSCWFVLWHWLVRWFNSELWCWLQLDRLLPHTSLLHRVKFSRLSSTCYTCVPAASCTTQLQQVQLHVFIDTAYTLGTRCGMHGIIAWCWDLFIKNRWVFIVLLLQLRLVWFSMIRVKIKVMLSFSDRVGVGLLNVKWVELYVGFPTCRHSHFHYLW